MRRLGPGDASPWPGSGLNSGFRPDRLQANEVADSTFCTIGSIIPFTHMGALQFVWELVVPSFHLAKFARRQLLQTMDCKESGIR